MLRCCREQSLSSVPSDSLALFVCHAFAQPCLMPHLHHTLELKLSLYTIHLYTQEPELASVFRPLAYGFSETRGASRGQGETTPYRQSQ